MEKKYVFLDEFDEGGWDLVFKLGKRARPSHKCN
jgi:hypothetical protein